MAEDGEKVPEILTGARPVGRPRTKTAEERAAFDAKVAKMRINGLTFDQIAHELNCHKGYAHAAYKRFMLDFAKHHQDDQSVLLAEFHSRMEMAWRAHRARYLRSAENSRDGVGDLKVMQEGIKIQCEFFDRAQSAGLLPKRHEEFDISEKDKVLDFLHGVFKKPTTTP